MAWICCASIDIPKYQFILGLLLCQLNKAILSENWKKILKKSHEIDSNIDSVSQYSSHILATRLEYLEWHLGMCHKWNNICQDEGVDYKLVILLFSLEICFYHQLLSKNLTSFISILISYSFLFLVFNEHSIFT